MTPGETLKALRQRLGFSYGEVERRSRKLARRQKNPDLILWKGYLVKIERGSEPGPAKLLALAKIYRISLARLLALWR